MADKPSEGIYRRKWSGFAHGCELNEVLNPRKLEVWEKKRTREMTSATPGLTSRRTDVAVIRDGRIRGDCLASFITWKRNNE